MTPTMEEVAGWLREAANDHALRASFSRTASGALTHQAKEWEFRNRAAQVEAMGWRPGTSTRCRMGAERRWRLCQGWGLVLLTTHLLPKKSGHCTTPNDPPPPVLKDVFPPVLIVMPVETGGTTGSGSL